MNERSAHSMPLSELVTTNRLCSYLLFSLNCALGQGSDKVSCSGEIKIHTYAKFYNMCGFKELDDQIHWQTFRQSQATWRDRRVDRYFSVYWCGKDDQWCNETECHPLLWRQNGRKGVSIVYSIICSGADQPKH